MRTGALKLKLQLICGDAYAKGPGKADILAAIDRKGSISAAGRALGMSYRRTWLLVDEMNRCFRKRLVNTQSGGASERGAHLTDEGRAVLTAYRDLEAHSAAVADSDAYRQLTAMVREAPLPAHLPAKTQKQSNSYAAFGEINWHPIDRVTVTGGLPYTYEYKTGTYDTFVFGGLPTTNIALNNAKLSILRGQNYAAQVNDGAFTGRANVAWQATDNALAYASFARGEKSGGVNMAGLPLHDQNLPALSIAVVRPEKNTAYEVGVKTRLFDNRLTFNIDAFYTRVTAANRSAILPVRASRQSADTPSLTAISAIEATTAGNSRCSRATCSTATISRT